MTLPQYDFAIIGAGSTGLIAAEFAVKLGARVVMMEKERIGGDCTWTGCVPSKALLKVASVAHEARTAAQYGVHTTAPTVNMLEVRAYLRSAIQKIYAGTTPEALRAKGMDILLGPVAFVDPHTLTCGDHRLRAKKVLIATGANPVVPPIENLASVPYSTYRDVFEADELPQSMAIVGGGPVGVELAQAFQRLGTQVTLFAERLLPKEEPEAAAALLRVLQREGVRVIAERALAVESRASSVVVSSSTVAVEVQKLFVASGRAPALEGLHLEAAGVAYSARGIQVNQHLRTSARHVYAAGDVVGGAQFSHFAGWQGFQAARNALLPGNSSGFSRALPRVTFTDPEVAHVGITEQEAHAGELPGVRIGCWPLSRVDRAVCDHDEEGFLKLIVSKNGHILGATIVGRRAGDAITELVVAMERRIKIQHLAGVIHPYPTYATGIQLLATEMATAQALAGTSGKLIRAAAKLYR